MTTPTNARQTSEREQLAWDLIENWPDDIECLAAARQLRADDRLDAELAALRAENEALRTVSDEDAEAARKAISGYYKHDLHTPGTLVMLTVLQSFIRSKESRRG